MRAVDARGVVMESGRRIMEFDDYQREALRTDRVQREGTGKEGRSVMGAHAGTSW